MINGFLLIIAAIWLNMPIAEVQQYKYSTGKESMLNTVYDFKVKNISGKEISLSEYKGKVLLIVNVASYCGYTRQYSGLQELYEKYKNDGFVILAFPCNDFGAQEPGSNEDIQKFCESKFGVTFPLFDKIHVLGDEKHKLYRFLTEYDKIGKGEIKWNFEKFLINKDGIPDSRYRSSVEPNDKKMIEEIERLLK